jgi:hypothetical protein
MAPPAPSFVMIPPALPPSVAEQFIAETGMGAPGQAGHMGWLKENGISPRDFADYCESFARGVAWVRDQFGSEPAAIVITDRKADGTAIVPHYNTGSKTIFLPRAVIARDIGMSTMRQGKTEPLILNHNDMAMMYGVEEAYHHYQFTEHKQKILFHNLPLSTGEGYDHDNAVEQDAKRVVRRAIVDLGLLHRPVATGDVDPEDLEWHQGQLAKETGWRQSIAAGRQAGGLAVSPARA